MTCVSLRLFNVYGTRSRSGSTYGAVLGVFLSQKINNYPLTIVGNGKQTKTSLMLVILSMRFIQYTKAKKVGRYF